MSPQPHLQAVKDGVPADEAAPSSSTPDQLSNSSSVGGSTPPGSGTGNPSRVQKQRADRSLPTDRMSFEKQVEVLRCIAQMSVKRPVTAEDLSAAVGLKGNRGGLSNRFFVDSGWVVTAGRGGYAAADPLQEYHRHLNVDPQDHHGARRYLANSARSSWYWEALEPMLEGGVRQTLALHTLSREAGANDHTHQLQLILEWLEWLGLIRREGDLVFPGSSENSLPAQLDINSDESPDQATDESAVDANTDELLAEAETTEPQSTATQNATVTPAGTDTSALVSFSFSVRITADDAAKLSGEQLQSLLDFAQKLRG